MPKDKSEQNREGGEAAKKANEQADKKGGGGKGSQDPDKWWKGHPTD